MGFVRGFKISRQIHARARRGGRVVPPSPLPHSCSDNCNLQPHTPDEMQPLQPRNHPCTPRPRGTELQPRQLLQPRNPDRDARREGQVPQPLQPLQPCNHSPAARAAGRSAAPPPPARATLQPCNLILHARPMCRHTASRVQPPCRHATSATSATSATRFQRPRRALRLHNQVA